MNSPMSHNQDLPASDIIFIVDDNAANLSVLSEFLDEVGFSVRVAKDGSSALRKITYEKPTLILLDIMMPGIDGFETCQRLKASTDTCDIPIIFMTALSDTTNKVKGLSMGAADYITKPFQQDEILARIKLQLRLRSLANEIEAKNLNLQQEVEQRRAAETALQDMIQQLKTTQTQMIAQEKFASLGSLTAGIAHELRNPLNFVVNFAETAHELVDELKTEVVTQCKHLGTAPSEEIASLMQDIQKSTDAIYKHSKRAENIISSMMQHARSDNVLPQATSMNDLLAEAVKFTYHSFRARKHGFNVTIHEDYDDAVGELNVIASALSRTFINVLDNAFYAVHKCKTDGAADASYQPQVWVKTIPIEDGVEIRIRDNGLGIPSDLRKQIFQPFITTKPSGQGTGLGLSMSHDIIVGQHGGRFTVNSDASSYTEFIIALPA